VPVVSEYSKIKDCQRHKNDIKFFYTLKVALIRNKGYYLQMPIFGVFIINNDVIFNFGYLC
jgi:hypothetical protein